MMFFDEECQLGFGSEQSRRVDPLFDGRVWSHDEYGAGVRPQKNSAL